MYNIPCIMNVDKYISWSNRIFDEPNRVYNLALNKSLVNRITRRVLAERTQLHFDIGSTLSAVLALKVLYGGGVYNHI